MPTKTLSRFAATPLLLAFAALIAFMGPATTAWAQTGQITGTVTNAERGETLPGVNVVVEGTAYGAATNASGVYMITDVEAGTYTISASFVGFREKVKDVEVVDGEATAVDFVLQKSALGLDEVVVTGYGTQQRRVNLTSSVSSVSSEEIEASPVSSVMEAIQGKAAGVTITRTGWDPSSETSIRIRGERSISGGNDPLLVVDGVTWSGTLKDLNPANVASVDILKGTAATAIYGSRGSNGVILVTTKEGTPGEFQVTYRGYAAAQPRYGRIDLMNAEEWETEVRRAFEGRDVPYEEMFNFRARAGIENGVDTDWQDLIFRTGFQQDHSFTFSGGDDQTQFRISPSFFHQRGISQDEKYERYSLFTRVSHQFSDRFQVEAMASAKRSNGGNTRRNRVLRRGLLLPPVLDPYQEEGILAFEVGGESHALTNPLSDLENTETEDQSDRLTASLSAEYEFLPSLSFETQFGPEVRYRTRGLYYGNETLYSRGTGRGAETEEDRFFHYTWNNILRYQQTFADRHNLNFAAIYTQEARTDRGSSAEVFGLPYASIYYNLGSADEIQGLDSYLSEWALQSFVGRLDYNFDDRYLLTLTARQDGSSRLAEGNKWSFFPSVAAAWRISNESFMDPLDGVLSNLKLRVGYGKSGNTAIAPYQVLGGLGDTEYAYGDETAFGYQPEDLPNPELSWEETTQLNVGLDFGLWEDRVSGSLEFYQQNTSDLLLTRRIPASTGFQTILSNIGATRNTGFELSLSTVNIETGAFQWRTDLNFSTNKNEIVELYGTGGDDVANEWFIGEPINVFYDYEYGGIWQEDEAEQAEAYGWEPGVIKVVDQNDDGAINAADRTILGSPYPDWTAGITNNLTYRNLDFSFVLYTRQGNMMNNTARARLANFMSTRRLNHPDVDYWTPENPDSEWPNPQAGDDMPYANIMRYIDGSYLRIRRVTLGYTLPSSLTQGLGADSWRLYVTAQNPYVFHSDRLVGFDPENGAGMFTSPSYRTFLFGVDLRF